MSGCVEFLPTNCTSVRLLQVLVKPIVPGLDVHVTLVNALSSLPITRAARPLSLKKLTVILPVYAEIQRQIGTELPVVFEIRAHFTLALLEELILDGRGAGQSRILGALDSESLVDRSDGARKVGQ